MAHTREEIFARCRKEHVPFTPVRNMGEVVNCEHLNQRKYFETIEYQREKTFKCPGSPVRFSQSPWNLDRPPPSLAEHNAEVYCDQLGYSKEEIVQWRRFNVI
jgi:CoA:oxalate CoA-transferase